MKYCPRCGVALAEEAPRCVLCGSSAVTEKPESADSGGVAYPSSGRLPAVDELPTPETLSARERRRIAVELLSVGFGIALSVTVLVDLFAERSITWSRYSSAAIAGAWLVSAMPIVLYRRPWILFSVLSPSLLLLVFLLDVFDGRISWFLNYGLPISLCLEASVAVVGALVATQKRKGLNAVALILCGASFFCFGVETTIDLNWTGALSYEWSGVVALALVPTSGLLFYLHYRIVNRASLRKLFRL